jgi:HEAT repeat protein
MDVDATRAYQSLRRMAVSSDQVVPFLAEHLVRKKPNPRKVARLLTDLDSEAFHVRSQAAKELEKLGEEVEPALRKALKDTPSVEVRRRILELLETLDPPHPEGVSPRLLRWLRAVEVLEWIDTPASRKLLKELAAAPPREEVGVEAKAALKRLHE